MGWAEIDFNMRYCVEPHARKNRYAIITFEHVLRTKSSCFALMIHVSHLRWNKYHPTCDGNGERVQFSTMCRRHLQYHPRCRRSAGVTYQIYFGITSIESSEEGFQVCRRFQHRLCAEKKRVATLNTICYWTALFRFNSDPEQQQRRRRRRFVWRKRNSRRKWKSIKFKFLK